MSERMHGKTYSMLEDERCYCGLAWPCPYAEPAPPLPKESQDAEVTGEKVVDAWEEAEWEWLRDGHRHTLVGLIDAALARARSDGERQASRERDAAWRARESAFHAGLATGERQGREKGLREAAKEAEESWVSTNESIYSVSAMIAAKIRALLAPPASEEGKK